MRKLITLLLACTALVATARHIAPDEAASVAESFLNRSVAGASQKTPRRALAVGDAQKPFYAFNAEDGQGFVLVSADDRAPRILGYADSGSFDINNLPPQLAALLDSCAVNLDRLPDVQHSSWKTSARSVGEAKVLPTANWGQNAPYNNLCPEVDGVRAPTGCVATAMAIIMKYNEWPQTTRGGEVIWDSYGIKRNYNFDNVSFDFNKMPNTFNEMTYSNDEAQEVARLMQAAGAGAMTCYSSESSSALGKLLTHSMYEYFRFSPSSQYIDSQNFTIEDWKEMMYSQINDGHPFIITGYKEEGGVSHAFVCDGYNDDGMLHINWGWDGKENGFFEISFLNGFKDYLCMCINLYNDNDETEYSKVWIDSFGIANIIFGHNISVTNVEQEVPFAVTFKAFNIPDGFTGDIAIALTDSNNNIIETCTMIRWVGYYDTGWSLIDPDFTDVVFSSEIKPDYKIQVVSKSPEEDWKFVRGTLDSPSWFPVVGNHPKLSHISFVLDDPDKILLGDYEPIDVMVGMRNSIRAYPRGGVVSILIDGQREGVGSDFSECDYTFIAEKESYEVIIRARNYENLLSRSYNVTSSTSLADMIPLSERDDIYQLTLTGSITASDLYFVARCLPSLRHLDLENSTIKECEYNRENYFPEYAFVEGLEDNPVCISYWNLESIRLPQNLEGFEDYALRFLYTEMPVLGIPASVKHYGFDNFQDPCAPYRFVKIDNPIPTEGEDGSFLADSELHRSYIVLYVPSGSKEAYENSPSWQGFQEIRESDSPYIGRFVQDEHFRYSAFTDFAIISGQSPESDYLVIPKDVEIEGERYPVRTTEHNILRIYLTENESFELPTSIHSVFSNKLIQDYTLRPSGFECGEIWIPGGTEDFHNLEGPTKKSMWDFRIDKKNNLFRIKPTFDPLGFGVDLIDFISRPYHVGIEDVKINGISIEQSSDGIYPFDSLDELNIEVFYSISTDYDGRITKECTTSTLYTPEFLQNMPSTQINVKASSVTIAAEGSTELKKDETVQLRATVLPETTTDKTVVWSSSDEEIASVNETGLVSAQTKEGNVTIYATCGEAVGSIEISVSTGSGVDNILVDNGNSFEVYTVSGLKINSGCNQSVLQKLPAGIYIIRQGSLVMKHVVK